MPAASLQHIAPAGRAVSDDQVRELVAHACPPEAHRGQRLLLIIPDGTRTAPIGLMFKTLHALLAPVAKKIDVMIALGTHSAMTDAEINGRVEISAAERATTYRQVEFINHE